jgi:hypothetical protein
MFAFRFLSVRFRFGFVRQEAECRRKSYAALLILICTKIQWRELRGAHRCDLNHGEAEFSASVTSRAWDRLPKLKRSGFAAFSTSRDSGRSD